MEATERGTDLSQAESDFIAERDSFYLVTVGENDYPYVQFCGGMKGFLKVLDQKTPAYVDFRGNMQYISIGNLSRNDKAALILMDYAQRQRLKIYSHIEIVEAKDDPQLIALLRGPGYEVQIERAMILRVEAFDWNCRQHITLPYTIEKIRVMNVPMYEHVARLKDEIARLKASNFEEGM